MDTFSELDHNLQTWPRLQKKSLESCTFYGGSHVMLSLRYDSVWSNMKTDNEKNNTGMPTSRTMTVVTILSFRN